MKFINENKSKDDMISSLTNQMEANKLSKGKDGDAEQARVRLQSELNEMKAKYQSLEQKHAS